MCPIRMSSYILSWEIEFSMRNWILGLTPFACLRLRAAPKNNYSRCIDKNVPTCYCQTASIINRITSKQASKQTINQSIAVKMKFIMAPLLLPHSNGMQKVSTSSHVFVPRSFSYQVPQQQISTLSCTNHHISLLDPQWRKPRSRQWTWRSLPWQ